MNTCVYPVHACMYSLVAMRSGLRTIFLLSVICCISVALALMCWIVSSPCQHNRSDHLHAVLPQRWMINSSFKGANNMCYVYLYVHAFAPSDTIVTYAITLVIIN